MTPPDLDTAAVTDAPSTGLGPNYRRLYTATVISNLGDGVTAVGYPWIASAVTRNPVLIAVIAVAQRLPWLLFTLPAGVITDRVDRRNLMVRMDVLRGLITAGVAVAVLGLGSGLPDPDHLDQVVGTRMGLYLALVASALLLGCAEVLRDNSSQTILPAIVVSEHLERANGRMWSAEMIANTFVGPPLGSLLLAASFFLPFAVDAVSFFVAAGLVALLVGTFRAKPAEGQATAEARPHWMTDLKEGVRWLWQHPLLRTLAITLGLLNLVGAMQFATLVLFAQEVLRTSPVEFAILNTGGAIGGLAGAWAASRITTRLGTGPSLALTLITGIAMPVIIGLTSWWPLVLVVFAIGMLVSMVWNVITVSLRQQIIPDHLLGRVNSVYRFFGWGMMPLGTALGGIVVWLAEPRWGRIDALRAPFFVSAAISLALAVVAVPKLTTERIESARAAAQGRRPGEPGA